MRLFSGSSIDFINLNIKNQLAVHLRQEFLKCFGFNPSRNEAMSWRNSLLRVALIFQQADLTDHGVFVEYKLLLSGKRVDVIICGRDAENDRNAVIIELKQWEKCSLTDYDSDYVLVWVGGGNRNVLHPSVQVGKYYLEENSSVFYEGHEPVKLHACSYLHNYYYCSTDTLFDPRYQEAIKRFPVYTADDTLELSNFLSKRLEKGDGLGILAEIEGSRLRPSKKLLMQVSTTIRAKLEGELRVFGNLKSRSDYSCRT